MIKFSVNKLNIVNVLVTKPRCPYICGHPTAEQSNCPNFLCFVYRHNVNKSNNYYSRRQSSMYADDTHVYIELSQSDTHKSIIILLSCLSDCLTDI